MSGIDIVNGAVQRDFEGCLGMGCVLGVIILVNLGLLALAVAVAVAVVKFVWNF